MNYQRLLKLFLLFNIIAIYNIMFYADENKNINIIEDNLADNAEQLLRAHQLEGKHNKLKTQKRDKKAFIQQIFIFTVFIGGVGVVIIFIGIPVYRIFLPKVTEFEKPKTQQSQNNYFDKNKDQTKEDPVVVLINSYKENVKSLEKKIETYKTKFYNKEIQSTTLSIESLFQNYILVDKINDSKNNNFFLIIQNFLDKLLDNPNDESVIKLTKFFINKENEIKNISQKQISKSFYQDNDWFFNKILANETEIIEKKENELQILNNKFVAINDKINNENKTNNTKLLQDLKDINQNIQQKTIQLTNKKNDYNNTITNYKQKIQIQKDIQQLDSEIKTLENQKYTKSINISDLSEKDKVLNQQLNILKKNIDLITCEKDNIKNDFLDEEVARKLFLDTKNLINIYCLFLMAIFMDNKKDWNNSSLLDKYYLLAEFMTFYDQNIKEEYWTGDTQNNNIFIIFLMNSIIYQNQTIKNSKMIINNIIDTLFKIIKTDRDTVNNLLKYKPKFTIDAKEFNFNSELLSLPNSLLKQSGSSTSKDFYEEIFTFIFKNLNSYCNNSDSFNPQKSVFEKTIKGKLEFNLLKS